MDRQERKAIIAAYKERKAVWGVYAVICTATGEAWVGCSRHLDSQQNGLWFALDAGAHPHRSLQAAWRAHGGREFKFEALDFLADDFPQLSRMDELRKRQALWRARLQATAL
jgi:hypothetical protein